MIQKSLSGAKGCQAEVARVGESVGEVFALNVASERGGGPVTELTTQPTRVIFVFARSKELVQVFIGEERTLQRKKHIREVSFISTISHTTQHICSYIQTFKIIFLFTQHLFVLNCCKASFLVLVTHKRTPCAEDGFTIGTFMSEQVGKMFGF